jgi:formylglycine-generating enzyme
LLTLPFEDLSRDGPLVDSGTDTSVIDTAEAAVETSIDVDVADVVDAEADVDAGTCANKTMDGDETDTDCGGSCAKCSGGRKCKVNSDCSSNSCEAGRCATCPVGMIRVPVGALAYCIDATEVTIAEYDEFVAKVTPKSVTFPTACKWKASETSFAPTPKPSGGANAPVRNVDWCDAWAYCDAQGNRLCGQIGTGTSKNPTPFDKYDDPNIGQWRHACSYGASPTWPYGSSADATKCNTVERAPDGGTNTIVPVRSLTGCNGTPAELNSLYDMSGNVAEWEDSCSGTSGEGDSCRVRGGSFRDKASAASCGVSTTRNRGDRQDWVGFRCCRL